MASNRQTLSALNLRVPKGMLERADELKGVAADAPELATLPSVTRSDVLRLALLRGLQALEAEYEAKVDEGLAIVMAERMADPENHKFTPLEDVLRECGL